VGPRADATHSSTSPSSYPAPCSSSRSSRRTA